LNTSAKAANLLGRSVISAGDRLRDLIVPDALAALVTAPGWIPGTSKRSVAEAHTNETKEKLRADLEGVLASNCPLCESVVTGLDKPFIDEGEADTAWAI
jgi:vacuolar protein sorting-associated protein 18